MQNASFCPISASDSNFNPRNAPCMDACPVGPEDRTGWSKFSWPAESQVCLYGMFSKERRLSWLSCYSLSLLLPIFRLYRSGFPSFFTAPFSKIQKAGGVAPSGFIPRGLFQISQTGPLNHISDLKNCSGSVTVSGFLVYSVGTEPSLKHSKIVFSDSGIGKRPVSASILEKTIPSGT